MRLKRLLIHIKSLMLTYSITSFLFGRPLLFHHTFFPSPPIPPRSRPLPFTAPRPHRVLSSSLLAASSRAGALSRAESGRGESSGRPGRGGVCACAVHSFGAGQVYSRRGSADALHCRLRSRASPCTLSSSWPAFWARVSPETPP